MKMIREWRKFTVAVAAALTPVAALAHPGHVHLLNSRYHGWSFYDALPLLFVVAVVVVALLRDRR